MGPIIHLRINFCKKKKEEEEEEKEEAASPVRPAGKDREMIGCPSAHSEGRVTPTGTDPHPTSTFTQHHAGAPTRPGSISWDLDSHRGDAARTLSGGLWRQQGCSRHNHGQRHTHPQVSVALTAPRQRLGDVSARSPPPCVYQPSSKWEQGPVSALPPWSHRPPPLGRSKEKFLASSVLPKESFMVMPPDRTHDGKGKAGGGQGVSSEGLEQSSSHRRDEDKRGQGQKDGDKSCSKAAQVNLRWRRTT